MAAEATPRINARYLEQFTNSTVRILGRVTNLRGESATIDASGSIQLHLNRVSKITASFSSPKKLDWRLLSLLVRAQDAHLTLNNAVEIIGKVQPDLSVKVFQAMDFGSNMGKPSPGGRQSKDDAANEPDTRLQCRGSCGRRYPSLQGDLLQCGLAEGAFGGNIQTKHA